MNENYQLPWDELLFLTNGTDANGYPLSSGTLAIDLIKKGETKVLKNILLNGAVFQVHMSGGCTVITMDFPAINQREYKVARTMCEEWLSSLDNPELDDQMLTLTLVPIFLEGAFYLVFNYLVFADGYRKEKGFRLILGFDNNATMPVIAEGEDVVQMIHDADADLEREIKELKESIAMAEEEKTLEDNPYAESVKNTYSNFNNNPDQKDDANLHPGYRISQEDDIE